MTPSEARNQLCKMVDEIAGRLGLRHDATTCLCDEDGWKNEKDDVATEVIEEMWRRLTDPRWEKEANNP